MGEQYITSGTAGLIVATQPLFTAIATSVAFRETPRFRIVVGLFIGLASMILIVLGSGTLLGSEQVLGYIGMIAFLLSESLYSYALVRFRKNTLQIPPVTSNGLQMISGGLFLLLLSLFFETAEIAHFRMEAYLSLLYLISFGSVVSYSIFFWLVKVINPLFPTTWAYVSPVIALFVGWAILGEHVALIQCVGTVVLCSLTWTC